MLVDFGYTPEVLLNNMSILNIDQATFDALVLSHGHYDHFGGMVGFLAANRDRLKRKIPFFVGGEDTFCIRRTATGDQFGALDCKAILDADLMLMISEGPAVVADHASGQAACSHCPGNGKPSLLSSMSACAAFVRNFSASARK